jgi:hypothetical protein
MIARLGSGGELRWAQEIYTSSSRTSLVQSRCSCYPLSVEFAVGVTNGREKKRAPRSLWCVAIVCVKAIEPGILLLPPTGSQVLSFIAQGRRRRLPHLWVGSCGAKCWLGV